jgi:hypothetical protein
MRKPTARHMAILLAAASFASLGACGSSEGGEAEKGVETASGEASGGAAAPAFDGNVAQLADPQVGDVWVANLDHFSAAEFGEAGGPDAFGFLQVVDVTASQVTVITETSSAPDQAAAINRLSDYQGSVAWDQAERIPINRADFQRLVQEQRILRTTRPAGGAAAPAPAATPAPAAAPAAAPTDGK